MTSTVSHRVDPSLASPKSFAALHQLHGAAVAEAAGAGLATGLLELVRLRASQLNGCAYCLDLHARAAHAAGETEPRLNQLAGWRESAQFDPGERAALALTESLTLIGSAPLPDEVRSAALREFGEARFTQLVWAITVVNAYNRLAIATHTARP